jgi:hypothetical protein
MRYAICRADDPESELGGNTARAWHAHFPDAQLFTIDERDANGRGLVRLVTYDPSGEKPWKYGAILFDFPEDAEEYERRTGHR